MSHEKYMRRCLQLARLGEYYVAPNPMVGAVLVRRDADGSERVVAEGWHRQYGGPHAEVDCLRAAEQRGVMSYEGCTLYVSLEPCSHYGKTPPCAQLLIDKKIPRVVAGCSDPNAKVSGRGVSMLQAAGIEVVIGVLEAECRELNKRFICLHEKHRPYVTLKWAQTADGFIDYNRQLAEDSKPLVISNAVTKQLVHQMRAENMAIMVGSRTALLDNPRLLTTRWSGRNPVRVLPDRHHVVPRSYRIFSDDSETIVYENDTDWQYILGDLAKRGIHSVMVEGGRQWLETILQSDIWDEIHVEVAPVTIGDGVPAPKVGMAYSKEATTGNHRLYVVTR
ncbi:MAG: bifunctional diaminohydroxyphosphoribosylaminopyrimidine deaminase/5-amino-6-(5-phosphoribosylamino)uracil reductase RibD [Paludibacteraceae bacterium]|nr:bifunctional diaminohydroxyphosphoribosylaminopyrimidine deaminase/5-amino-6-(5-phosphoribosylamino)uracil reductase RibD [Paludibacteraceae bacterium]